MCSCCMRVKNCIIFCVKLLTRNRKQCRRIAKRATCRAHPQPEVDRGTGKGQRGWSWKGEGRSGKEGDGWERNVIAGKEREEQESGGECEERKVID